jgi:tetratricopeptide (TPR) repeat protein
VRGSENSVNGINFLQNPTVSTSLARVLHQKLVSWMIKILRTFAVLVLAGEPAFAQDPAEEAQYAQRAMASGNYGQAVDIYSRLSSAFPQNLDIKRNLGLALHSMGRYSDALECFDFILQRAPLDKAALLFSGIELTGLDEPTKAITNLTRVLEHYGEDSTGLFARGRAYLSLDEFTSAAQDFSKVIQLDPQNTKAWEGLGKAYLLGAQQAFEFVEGHGAFSGEWYALLARSYLSQEDYKMAFRFFHEAESHSPDLPGVHAGLAELYRQTNHTDWAATESAREAKATDVASTELRRKYLDALNFQQRGTEALAHLAHNPDTPEYHALLGLAYRIQRRDIDSVTEYRHALALSPNSATLKIELATALAIAKDCNAAISLSQDVLRADPNSPRANQVLGECFVDTNRPREAMPFLKAALKKDPHLLPAESALGRAYFHSGDYREALIHLRRAISLGDPSVLYQLGEAYGKLGDQKASADYLAQYKAHMAQIREANETPVAEIKPP